MISDKLRSLLLFTGIPVPQQAWKSCICLLPTAAPGAGQGQECKAGAPEGWAASAAAKALLGSPHTRAKLWHFWALCPSTLITPFRENWREIGQNAAPALCNRHRTR